MFTLPFVGLSSGNIPAALPRKRLNNMDITFIKSRGTELENYLKVMSGWAYGEGAGVGGCVG